jgi:hypothetical protein
MLICFRYSVRKTPLYNNAYLESPDGSPLCVCDIKKAKWYVEKDLGVVICEEPYKVRLRFEPAGRPVGQAGKHLIENAQIKVSLIFSFFERRLLS